MDATDITMGPLRNRIAMLMAAIFGPQAMILGCRAMNSPAGSKQDTVEALVLCYLRRRMPCLPRLNMAIPSPASEIILMDSFTSVGMSTPHLKRSTRSSVAKRMYS